MNKTTKNVLKVLAIVLMVVAIVAISTNVFAITPGELTPDDSVQAGDVTNTARRVAGLIRNIAVIAAVIVIMVLGVKYILGSVEEKAEYKKSFVPLIIGVVLVVGATQIATMIFNIMQ